MRVKARAGTYGSCGGKNEAIALLMEDTFGHFSKTQLSAILCSPLICPAALLSFSQEKGK
jgi:hypothetical protein